MLEGHLAANPPADTRQAALQAYAQQRLAQLTAARSEQHVRETAQALQDAPQQLRPVTEMTQQGHRAARSCQTAGLWCNRSRDQLEAMLQSNDPELVTGAQQLLPAARADEQAAHAHLTQLRQEVRRVEALGERGQQTLQELATEAPGMAYEAEVLLHQADANLQEAREQALSPEARAAKEACEDFLLQLQTVSATRSEQGHQIQTARQKTRTEADVYVRRLEGEGFNTLEPEQRRQAITEANQQVREARRQGESLRQVNQRLRQEVKELTKAQRVAARKADDAVVLAAQEHRGMVNERNRVGQDVQERRGALGRLEARIARQQAAVQDPSHLNPPTPEEVQANQRAAELARTNLQETEMRLVEGQEPHCTEPSRFGRPLHRLASRSWQGVGTSIRSRKK